MKCIDIDTIVIDVVADLDEAADTLRFARFDLDETPADPDETSFYDLTSSPLDFRGIQQTPTRQTAGLYVTDRRGA